MGNVEIYEHLDKIDAYLLDEDTICKLLYLLPTNRGGLSILAEALFSNNKDIAKLSAQILTKI